MKIFFNKKQLMIFSVSIILLSLLTISAFAHAGRTDEQGGHFDNEAQEYHYHHGYPAHQHEDGECPYNFVDNEDKKETKSANNKTTFDWDAIKEKNKEIPDNSIKKNSNNKKIHVISVLIIIAISLKVFLLIRKKIRRKKTLYYLSILKPQLISIKEDKSYIDKAMYKLLRSNLIKVKEEKYNTDKAYYTALFTDEYINNTINFPDGIIYKNETIIDLLSDKEYGRYTAYKTLSGTAIHFKKGCSDSYIPINLLELDCYDKKKKPCKKCFSEQKSKLIETQPEWYLEYLKIIDIKNKYNIT